MTTYASHRKAKFDYEILDTYEAGLLLSGLEVKSIRQKKVRLEGAFVVVRGGEAFIVGLQIPAYQPLNAPKSYDPERTRKLLLSKKEIAEIDQKTNTERLTAIPLKLYNSGRKIKLEMAVVRGKKKHDKRETIKSRDSKRDIERTLKNQI
jgi:SsrA-binding protein